MPRIRWFALITALAGILCGVSAGGFFLLSHDLPQINQLKQFKPAAVTRILSADGNIIATAFEERRYPVSYEKIPEILIKAIITTEDRDFFQHSGIHFKGILRAIIHDLRSMRFKQGASTLTQQLAKTLFLTKEKSFTRKIKEAILALQIERRYTKKEILALYLNQIYFGSGAYGVEAASRSYFGCSVSDVTTAQAALLAGLPKAPSVYSVHPDLARKRRHVVLTLLRNEGIITPLEFEAADAGAIFQKNRSQSDISNSFYVEYVKFFLRHHFDDPSSYLRGMQVFTAMDRNVQNVSEAALAKQLNVISDRMAKKGILPEKLQGAVIALDPATGAIRGMVGGKDISRNSFNRAVNAFRQPGSAFKPFVYAAALLQGAAQNDLILDAPLSYELEEGKTWNVNNFSPKFYGKMTLRQALALSKNTPAVRLMETTGILPVIRFARNAGISAPLSPNLSLALGTSEVSLLELTAAYIPFVSSGVHADPFCIEKIVDADGRIIYENSIRRHSVMSRQDAAIMADMLKAVVQEGTGRKALQSIQRDIGGKTGTTDNYRDAWFIGFCPDLALGVWIGNDDGRSLGKNETGASAALPVWIQVMDHWLDSSRAQYFDIPDGTKMVYMTPENGRIVKQQTRSTIKILVKTKDSG